jgi:hypothetical protein
MLQYSENPQLGIPESGKNPVGLCEFQCHSVPIIIETYRSVQIIGGRLKKPKGLNRIQN